MKDPVDGSRPAGMGKAGGRVCRKGFGSMEGEKVVVCLASLAFTECCNGSLKHELISHGTVQ